MRVGVYVDGYNLYYGARMHFGKSTPGWRWLDVRRLVQPLVGWNSAVIQRIVYCTARVDQEDNPSASHDQAIYLEALASSRSVDLIEEGRYVSWAKEEPLVGRDSRTYRPRLHRDAGEDWDARLPLRRRRMPGDEPGLILARVRKREEKGSDVNVASHLLHDVLTGVVDGAVVVSNDSDLELPLRLARERVPVGTVNPSTNPTAGALKGDRSAGAGGHWWRRLREDDYRRSQLADSIGRLRKPDGW